MIKRIFIAGLIVLGITLTALAIKLHGPVGEAWRSCGILRAFAHHVQNAEWAEAQDMLQTDPEWCRIEDGKVLYLNYDVTARIASARPRFWTTLVYYITDRQMGDNG